MNKRQHEAIAWKLYISGGTATLGENEAVDLIDGVVPNEIEISELDKEKVMLELWKIVEANEAKARRLFYAAFKTNGGSK